MQAEPLRSLGKLATAALKRHAGTSRRRPQNPAANHRSNRAKRNQYAICQSLPPRRNGRDRKPDR